MPGQFDRVYRDRVLEAAQAAAFQATIDPATNTAVFRVPEMVDALISLAATLLATNERMTRTEVRVRCDELSKDLFRRTMTGRDVYARTGKPFETVYLEERH